MSEKKEKKKKRRVLLKCNEAQIKRERERVTNRKERMKKRDNIK